MTALDMQYDAAANKTHVKVQTSMFTEWYWISGKYASAAALATLRPLIEARLAEFAKGEADTPHEIESSNAGLL